MSIFDQFSKKITQAKERKRQESLQGGQIALLRANTQKAREEYPEETMSLNEFLVSIQEKLSDRVSILDPQEPEEKSIETKDAEVIFYLTKDKMLAFACVLPPVHGGQDVHIEQFMEELKSTGIVYGIKEDAIKRTVTEKNYLCPFLAALGTAPIDGEDGILSDAFERVPLPDFNAAANEEIDFSQEISMQIIKKDEALSYRKPAVDARDGKDIMGNALFGKPGVDVELTSGENTYVSADGKQLLAAVDGAVSITADGVFCVVPQRTILGDVGRHTGNVYCQTGNLYISGNVREDVIIKSVGDIIVGGSVREASLNAEGSIRIQKGCTKGKSETMLTAKGQVQCVSIEDATVRAGSDVFAEVIMDSQITSGGSIYAISGQGLLAGGDIKAHSNVVAKEVGTPSEHANYVRAGYRPELAAAIDAKDEELKEARATMAKVRKNVLTLEALGDDMPPEKRKLLEQLEEQSSLYRKKIRSLMDERETLTMRFHASGNGAVISEKIYPVTEIQIADKTKKIQETLTDRKIALQGNMIVVKET
ncbi:MAG: DUF342 domain-containing protein [Firmicutes bacterium]|jgi:uncharacterized protein (DUF342 family)|nr:DUF342 domain-containing protein [Bacillota bacterium]